MNGISYASVYDEDGSVGRTYGVLTLPTLVIVDAKGRIVGVRRTLVRESELVTLVEKARAG
jgi:hypothetical protein